jgi:hypothetical protein
MQVRVIRYSDGCFTEQLPDRHSLGPDLRDSIPAFHHNAAFHDKIDLR